MRLSTRLRPARDRAEPHPVDPARAQHERRVREARLDVARRNPLWVKIEDDLVERGRHWLVSAGSDAVYLPHRGTVFQSGSSNLVADHVELAFIVTPGGDLRFLDRQPATWSEIVARMTRRRT